VTTPVAGPPGGRADAARLRGGGHVVHPRRPLAPRAAFGLAALAVLAPAVLPGPLGAQEVRGQLTTTLRFWQLRPLVRDTVPPDSVESGFGGRPEFRGQPLDCEPSGECVRLAQGGRADALGLTQDLSITAWDLGMPGLSATALLRGRWDAAGDLALPRTDDPFDAILAYAEYVRGPVRARAGRLRALGGLGSSGYDGAEVRVDPWAPVSAAAYGGRSLARGLEEPRDEILAGIDDFAPRRGAYLIGGTVAVRPAPGSAIGLRYQREILSDRSALLSERVSLDARVDAPLGLRVSGGADYDFAFGRVGKASISVARALPAARARVVATARRYVPYFELWTIWGFFSPVAYHEGELAAAWSPAETASVTASAAYRRYGDADAPVVFDPLEEDALRLAASGAWSPDERWTLRGSYAWENGVGAFRSTGSLRAAWRASETVEVALRAAAYQQIREFRVGEGAVWSGGADGSWAIADGAALTVGLDAYRQTFENRPSAFDWTQLRGWSAFTVRFGGEPGASAPRLPPRLLPGGDR